MNTYAALATVLLSTALSMPVSAAELDSRVVNEPGLNVVLFDTRYGNIRCNLPSTAKAGDTVSGTIFVEPSGRSESERGRMENQLNELTVFVDGQECPVRLGEFSVKLSGASVPVELKDKKGSMSSPQTVTMNASTLPPGTMAMQAVTQQNGPVQCRGSFDGNFENTTVTIGGKPAVKVAESPGAVVALCPGEIVGSTQMEIKEGETVASGRVDALSVTIAVADNRIERGRSTTATVHVYGTDRLEHPVQLQLQNRTPGVVTMDGGNVQIIELQAGPQFDTARRIVGVRSGMFQLEAKLLGTTSR